MGDISNGIGFRAALGQFGGASFHLAEAFIKSPFTGGWKRLVVVGPPVLFVTAGIGALIYAIMIRSIRSAGSSLSSFASKQYKNFFQSRTVEHIPPTNPQNNSHLGSVLERVLQNPLAETPQNKPIQVKKSMPLLVDAAKERNESLIKLLGLIEKHVIEPLIKKKDICFGEFYSEEGFKSWLMSMTLWRLGIAWDQLENQYLEMQTPPPPTLESIIAEAKNIDKKIGDVFEKNTPKPDSKPIEIENSKEEEIVLDNSSKIEEKSDKSIKNILDAITSSTIANQKKLELMALYLKIETILTKSPTVETKNLEEQEIRKKYALIMHHGMSNTLVHMTGIVEGWIKVFNKPVNAVSFSFSNNPKNTSTNETQLSNLVKDVSSTVKKDITDKYLMPLWNKKNKQWNDAVEKDLNSLETKQFFQNFMDGKISEKEFLENPESRKISTALTSSIFFMRAVRSMGLDLTKLSNSTKSIVNSLFVQVEPTLVDILKKSTDMIAQISFERTVPKVVDYFIELLKCSTTMQEVRQKALEVEVPSSDNQLVKALEGVGLQKLEWEFIDKLYKKISPQISGKVIVKSLPEKSVHKVVIQSLNSPRFEEGWIRQKKEQIKTLLKLHADKFAQKEGEWLSNLFKPNSTGQSTNLVSTLLTYSNKLREFPGMEGVMSFLFSGVQSVIENKSVEATQVFINELTSTGYLSSTIATSLVKGLVYKDEKKWKENLSILRQAYLFLQPAEQELVLKHLAVQFEGGVFEERKKELENSQSIDKTRAKEIEEMKELENDYKRAEERLIIAIKDSVSESSKQGLPLLLEACEKLKREKELQQFNRVRTVVTYVAGEFLAGLSDYTGGASLKDLCIRVLNETLNLLTCQEIIKHWIFTIVDLILEELEESGNSKPIDQKQESKNAQSLLDFIGEEKKQLLLTSLSGLMETSQKDNSYVQSSFVWLTKKVTQWAPNTIWSFIEPFKEKFVITPLELKDKIIESVGEYGKDPNGLSDVIIQSLTEYVADPR